MGPAMVGCHRDCWRMSPGEEGIAYGGLLIPGRGCPVLDVKFNLLK